MVIYQTFLIKVNYKTTIEKIKMNDFILSHMSLFVAQPLSECPMEILFGFMIEKH